MMAVSIFGRRSSFSNTGTKTGLIHTLCLSPTSRKEVPLNLEKIDDPLECHWYTEAIDLSLLHGPSYQKFLQDSDVLPGH